MLKGILQPKVLDKQIALGVELADLPGEPCIGSLPASFMGRVEGLGP